MANSKEINWGPSIFLISYQLILLAALPFYFYFCAPAAGTLVSAVILLFATGISITGGYHRYYAHRTYKTNPFVEGVLLFFATMSAQGSALRWGFDHRLHHAFVDTDNDPYSIKKGFWYAHCLWILEKPRSIDPKVVPDLMNNKMLQFQHRWYGLLMVLTNAIAFFAVGLAFQDFWGALVLAVFARMCALHHFTWFINSLAHTWGDKPFSQEQSAVDNYIISLLTFGEGYHNYHHTYANDYRNGIRWYHFDPTKWLIWGLSKLGLAHALKTIDPITIKKRMVIEHKNLLLEQIQLYWNDKKQELESQVQDLSERILNQISEFNKLKNLYNEIKSKNPDRYTLARIKQEIKDLQKGIQSDWRLLYSFSRSIMRQKPLPSF